MSSKQPNWPFIINLGNSIIGVSILAMPFCFKECGVLLGLMLLLASACLTHTSCSLLMRGAFTSRKRSYEYLALHTFGPAGKLCVEISIIGLLIGTCVAFFVIIGDLGPAIISRLFLIDNTWNLRLCIMVFLAFTVALPLGLLKNIESLANISAMSIGFYSVFIAEVFTTAFPNLWSGVWVTRVVYWNPEGVFRCLPIFSLAFACQTQLFVMYDALHDASLKRMGTITRSAIGMVTFAYLTVGFFGYVAFCQEEISGDILLNFRSTIFSEAVKLGFVLSVAVSFPLVIFPLRAAIYTLVFFKHDHDRQHDIIGPIYMPDLHLKGITLAIIMTTLTIGILLPNIEFVLALTGATMGSMICFIFPAVMFISVASVAKNSGRSTAQFVLFLGFTILVASTYVTLNSQDRKQFDDIGKAVHVQPAIAAFDAQDYGELKNQDKVHLQRDPEFVKPADVNEDSPVKKSNPDINKEEKDDNKVLDADIDKREEPPNPMEPDDNQVDAVANQVEEEHDAKQDQNPIEAVAKDPDVQEDIVKEVEKEQEEAGPNMEEPENEQEIEEQAEKEAAEVVKEQNAEAKQLLVELKEQHKVQEDLIEQQRQIIEELKQHKKESHAEQDQEEAAENEQKQAPVKQQKENLEAEKEPINVEPINDGLAQQQPINNLVAPKEPQELAENQPQDRPEKHLDESQRVDKADRQLDEVQVLLDEVNDAKHGKIADNPVVEGQRDQGVADKSQAILDKSHNAAAKIQPAVDGARHQHPAAVDNAHAAGHYQKQPSPVDSNVAAQHQPLANDNPRGAAPELPAAGQFPPAANQKTAPDSAAVPAQVDANADTKALDEAYLTQLLVNLAQKPDFAADAQQLDPAVAKMIGSLSNLNAGEQWEVQLRQNIAQLLENPPLAEALHNVAVNAGVDGHVPAHETIINKPADIVHNADTDTHKKAKLSEQDNINSKYPKDLNLNDPAPLKVDSQKILNKPEIDNKDQVNIKDKTLTIDKLAAQDKLEKNFNNRELDRAIKDNLAAG